MPRSARLRVGLIGAGWASGEHAATIAASGRGAIVAVLDLDAQRAASLAADHGARVAASLAELLDPALRLDAVVVGTPPGAHRDPVVAALEAGVSVFVEKPLARTREDGLAIVRAAAAAAPAGTVCAVGYQWRAVEALDALDARLADEPAGLIASRGVGITQARDWFYDPSLSAQLIGERASHHIDLQGRVAGPVEAVQGTYGRIDLSGAGGANAGASVLTLTLRYRSGAVGSIQTVWVREGTNRHDLTVVTGGGLLELELDPAFTLRGPDGTIAAPRGEAPFGRQMTRFLDAVERPGEAAVYCTPCQAYGTLDVVVACEHAVRTPSFVPVDGLPQESVDDDRSRSREPQDPVLDHPR